MKPIGFNDYKGETDKSGLCVVPSEGGFTSGQQLAVDDGRGLPRFLTHLLFLQAPLLLLYAAAEPCCQRPQPPTSSAATR
ncbi:unnamed protein product [Arctogadus glacialis]